MSKPTKKETALWQTAREQSLSIPKIAEYTNQSESTIANHTLMLNKSKQAVNNESLRTTRRLLKNTRQSSHNATPTTALVVGVSVVSGILGAAAGGLLALSLGNNVVTTMTIMGLMFLFLPVAEIIVILSLEAVSGVIFKLYFLIKYREKIAAIKAITKDKDKAIPNFKDFCLYPFSTIDHFKTQ